MILTQYYAKQYDITSHQSYANPQLKESINLVVKYIGKVVLYIKIILETKQK